MQTCKCLEEIEDPATYEVNEKLGKVLWVTVKQAAFVMNSQTGQMGRAICLTLAVRFEKSKTLKRQNLFCTYCPFCGASQLPTEMLDETKEPIANLAKESTL